MDDAEDAGPQYAQRPDSLKALRACKNCKLIKTYDQFVEHFCENCWLDWADGTHPSSLNKSRRQDEAHARTTPDFEGMTAMMQPEHSWVARWLRMHRLDADHNKVHFKPGLYAISLPGEDAEASKAAEEAEEAEEEEEDEEEEEEDGGAQLGDSDEEDRGAARGAARSGARGGSGAARGGAGGSSGRGADLDDALAGDAAGDAAIVERDEDSD